MTLQYKGMIFRLSEDVHLLDSRSIKARENYTYRVTDLVITP